MVLQKKKPARQLYYRRRHNSLLANDAIKAAKIKKIILAMMAYMATTKLEPDQREQMMNRLRMLSAYYLYIVVDRGEALERPIRLNFTIDSFSSSDCRIFFRFRQPDLHCLHALLQIPEKVVLENRSVMRGEEVLLRGLYELASGESQHKVGAIFGRDGSTQSRVFAWFINHMYDTFHHLVHDNLGW